MRAEFEVETPDADIVYRSLLPESGRSERATVEVELEKNKVLIRINAEDVVMLRAAINTWLRLVKVAMESTFLKRLQ